MGFHVHGQLTASLEGQLEETVPGETVPASGDFRAPSSKSWHFAPPGIALPHKHFHFKPVAGSGEGAAGAISGNPKFTEPWVGPWLQVSYLAGLPEDVTTPTRPRQPHRPPPQCRWHPCPASETFSSPALF